MKKERIAGLVPACKLGGVAMALLMLVGMASCGGNSDPNALKLEVKPELGELGDYMTIESKEAVISLIEFTDDGKPYVKIASTLQVKVNKDVATDWGFDLDVVVLDANMNEITDFGYYDIEDATDYDFDKEYRHYLKAGDYRAVMDKSGEKEEWNGKPSAMWEMMRQNGKYIVLKPRWSSKYVPYKGGSASSSAVEMEETMPEMEETEVEMVSVSGEDWDKVLDEYESYCTKLVAAAKKAKAGDMSVMTEYASLVESAESLQKKLENAGSNLTAAQAARLNKIAANMAQAMM
ncbi:MAG: hypothetical protein K2K25_09800 [Muribaculaceae bacterium]|nr:hypothetical protein [Muribaculaceae bacterium]